MSAHQYSRNFANGNNGMIPWLLITELLCHKYKDLSQLVKVFVRSFSNSGEINSVVEGVDFVMKDIKNNFKENSNSEIIKIIFFKLKYYCPKSIIYYNNIIGIN